MALRSPLLKRKRWYTLEDAARRLSIEFEEEIYVKDVLQLALDKDLPLCAFFRSQLAKPITESNAGEGYVDTELFYSERVEGPPTISIGRPVSVDDSEATYLDGIYRLSNKTYALSRTLESEITGSKLLCAHAGLWSVEEVGGDGEAFLIFDHGMSAKMTLWPLKDIEEINEEISSALNFNASAQPGPSIDCKEAGGEIPQPTIRHLPSESGPSVECMVVLRTDLDAFIESQSGGEVATDKKSTDDILALEAMGLLAEAFAKQTSAFQHGDKPNQSAIAEKMLEVVPQDVTKMSKRKLQGRLKDALEAWEAKKRR